MESDNKPVDMPVLKRNQSETGPEIARQRRMEIVDTYVKKLGLGNARAFTKQIAEKYKIGERQVRKDFQWIKGNIKPEDTAQVKLDLKILRDKTLNLALLGIEAAASPQERNEAIKTAWVVIEKYRQDLEEWGEKSKIADKHEISSGGPAIFNLVTKSAEEIKSGKSNQGTGNKPETAGNAGNTG